VPGVMHDVTFVVCVCVSGRRGRPGEGGGGSIADKSGHVCVKAADTILSHLETTNDDGGGGGRSPPSRREAEP